MKQVSCSTSIGAEQAVTQGFYAQNNDGSHRQIEFLGRARIYADGRPGDVALWRKHALSGADCARRHANHFGLRHRPAHAGKPLGRAERRKNTGDAYPGHALPLGSHSRDSFFFAAVRGEQRISVLQLPVKISGTRQPETSFRSADGASVFSRGYVGDERQAKVQGAGRRRFVYGWREQNHGALAESSAGLPGLSNRDASGDRGVRHGQRARRREIGREPARTGGGGGHLHQRRAIYTRTARNDEKGMGTFLVAGGSESGAASRGEDPGAIPPRPRFDGSHGGFDPAAGARRVRFGVRGKRRYGGDARSAGRPRAGAHARDANGLAA